MISANSRENQEFLLNCGFYFLFPTFNPSVFYKCVTFFMSPMNITGFRKRKLESPELSVKQLFKRQQQLMSEHNHIAAKFLDLIELGVNYLISYYRYRQKG